MIANLLDTETSGLIDNHSIKLERQPHVIEYYARRTNLASGEFISDLEMLIAAPVKLDAKITEITGITDELLAGRPLFASDEVALRIAQDIESSEVIIAQNASFDKEMLDIEFERLGRKLAWPRIICTVEATIHYKGFRLGLQALHEYLFNEPFADHHRAKPDVLALERICIELFKRGDL